MAKKFIDNAIWGSGSFVDLNTQGKIVYLYIITNCDSAGFLQFSERMFCLATGVPSLKLDYIKTLNKDIVVRDGWIFLKDHISFIFPKGLDSKSAYVRTAVNRLVQMSDRFPEVWDIIPEGTEQSDEMFGRKNTRPANMKKPVKRPVKREESAPEEELVRTPDEIVRNDFQPPPSEKEKVLLMLKGIMDPGGQSEETLKDKVNLWGLKKYLK